MKNGINKIWGYRLSRKNKSIKPKRKKEQGFQPNVRIFAPQIFVLGVSLCIIIVLFFSIRYFFLNSEVFKVRHILVNKPSPEVFRNGEKALRARYTGRNIFSVAPSHVEILLRAEYPYLNKIRVRRVFPDTIEVDMVEREKAACLDTSGGIVIDSGGMVLSVGEYPDGLVRIKGVNFIFSRPHPGVVLKEKGIEEALAIIDELVAKARVKQSDLQLVDISDRNNISVTIKNVPVNLGREDVVKKVNVLKDILNDPKIDLGGIRYIDLRFKDPVYSFKRN